MPEREHALATNQRITAGIPSLSPEKRHDITEKQLLNLYQKTCQKEYFDNEAKTKTPDGEMSVTDAEQRAGKTLMGWQFAIDMQKMAASNGRSLYIEPSRDVANTIGLYSLNHLRKKYMVCSFPMEVLAEFFLCITDDHGMTKQHLPGWRTAGSKLIAQGFVRESQFHQKYGPPSQSSANWQRMVL